MTAQEKWLKSNDMLELAEMLKALAHTSRVSIMFLLCSRKEKRLTVKYIYEELEMPQPVRFPPPGDSTKKRITSAFK